MTTPRSAALLVGGLGTRMHPLTLTRPKHLLPVGGVPVLDLQLLRLVELGVSRVVLATARHAEAIERHVRQRPIPGLEVLISTEGQPLGTGGGLLAALEVLAADEDEAVVVVNGDLLTGHDLLAQAAACTPDCDVVLHVRAAADPTPFGTVDLGGDRREVVGFREKVPGPPGTFINAGTYVLRPRALRGLAAPGPLSWERDLLPTLIARGATILAHHEESWFADIGSPAALVNATRAALDGTAAAALPADFDPTRATSADTVVSAGARLRGGSTGSAVRLGRDAVVTDSILLDHVDVGAGAHLVECVVGEGAVIAAGARLNAVAIGDGARIARDGTLAHGHDEGKTP